MSPTRIGPDADLATHAAALLRRQRLDVAVARSADEAAGLLMGSPDAKLVCLELNLPAQNQELLDFIAQAPAFLTIARVDHEDGSTACLAFATSLDYEYDPAMSEIVARVRTALRSDRRPLAQRRRLVSTDGRIIADSDREALLKDGQEVKLSRAEWEILYCLAEDPGRILSREELMMKTTRGSEGGRLADLRTIDAHVKNIRRKLCDSPHSPDYLLTARGRGYYLQGFERPRKQPVRRAARERRSFRLDRRTSN